VAVRCRPTQPHALLKPFFRLLLLDQTGLARAQARLKAFFNLVQGAYIHTQVKALMARLCTRVLGEPALQLTSSQTAPTMMLAMKLALCAATYPH
jgi:hypothetical protein